MFFLSYINTFFGYYLRLMVAHNSFIKKRVILDNKPKQTNKLKRFDRRTTLISPSLIKAHTKPFQSHY